MIVGDVLHAVFPIILKHLCSDRQWADPALDDRITITADVDDHVQIEHVAVPITWSLNDMVRNNTEQKQIVLVRHMGENAIQAHDHLLLQAANRHRNHRLQAVRAYRYFLDGPYPIHGQQAWYSTLMTAYTVGPVRE